MTDLSLPESLRADVELILGHLNFSNGERSVPFFQALNNVFAYYQKNAAEGDVRPAWRRVQAVLFEGLDRLSHDSEVFAKDAQARKAMLFVFRHFFPKYRKWHRNILFHQPDEALFQAFFTAMLFELVLELKTYDVIQLDREQVGDRETSAAEPLFFQEMTPENRAPQVAVEGDLRAEADFLKNIPETDAFLFDISSRDAFLESEAMTPYGREVAEAFLTTLDEFDDFVGYRPVPVLRTHQKMQPYDHEWVRALPIYLKDAGTQRGPYEEMVAGAMKIILETHPDLLRTASLDPEMLEELTIDPRALDFEHPVNRRLNYHFGGWDMQEVTNKGYFRRFVLIEATVNAILSRIGMAEELGVPREELMLEASAVLAGTMLMGSMVTGWGPGAHDSSVTFATMLPQVAQMRDQFYQQLMRKITGKHGERLRQEAIELHQPFAQARQFFNTSLARIRAEQYQNVQLARLYAWMGYTRPASDMLASVHVPSVRMRCEAECLLTLAHLHLDRKRVRESVSMLYRIERILCEGVRCGAMMDPWCILGFSGQFPLSQSIEDSTVDHRVDEFNARMSSIFSLYSRILKESAALGMTDIKAVLSARMLKLADWWDQFGSDAILETNGFSGQETWESTQKVVAALETWHEGGTATGDIGFWRPIAADFSSAKAYVLLIEALLDQHDLVAAMALLITWLSQSELIPLEDGDYSFHPLALRWMEDLWYPPSVEQRLICRRGDNLQDGWEMAKKFIDYVDANADIYNSVPQLEVKSSAKPRPPKPPRPIVDDFPLPHFDPDAPHTPLDSVLEEIGWFDGDNPPYPQDDDDDDDDLDLAALFGDEMPFEAPPEFGDSEDAEDSDDSAYREEDADLSDILGAAWENVTYKDTTDDGVDAEMMEFGEQRDSMKDFPLTSEMERVSDRLQFFITHARLWKMAAVFSVPFADKYPQRSESLQAWAQQADAIYAGLETLLAQVEAFEIEEPLPTQSSLMEFEKQRSLKDSLLERIIATSSELLDAKRLMAIADTQNRVTVPDTWETATQCVMQALLCGEAWKVPMIWEHTMKLLLDEPLLYRPLSRGGDPGRIVRTRSVLTVLERLLYNLPLQGLLTEALQLLALAQQMERQHPAGMRSITRYDHLFQIGARSIVRAILLSAAEDGIMDGAMLPETLAYSLLPDAQEMDARMADSGKWDARTLFHNIGKLVDLLTKNWHTHSRGIRISSLDSISNDAEWEDLKDFIQTYGNDLFAPTVLSYGNLQAIHHQGVRNWILSLMEEDETPEMGASLAEDLNAGRIDMDAAENHLEVILETLLERYGEFIDYNTTTTQSDKGENLYVLLDFLRLRAKYDRAAWEMYPIMTVHAVMVRNQFSEIAEAGLTSMMRSHIQLADKLLIDYAALQKEYGVSIKSVKDRLEERFVAGMTINTLQALMEPSITEARSSQGGDTPSFRKFLRHVQTFVDNPTGTGFEPPRWLEEVEEEVHRYRNKSEEDDEMLDLKDYTPRVTLTHHDVREKLQTMEALQTTMLSPMFTVGEWIAAFNRLQDILSRLNITEPGRDKEVLDLKKEDALNVCAEDRVVLIDETMNARVKHLLHEIMLRELDAAKKAEAKKKKPGRPKKKKDEESPDES